MSAAAGSPVELVDDLARVDPAAPGWSRRRRGRGFSYHDERGRPLTSPDALDRIRALAIPPAWRDVWISPLEDGHIQAVGTDDAGRRQYRYHDEWRRARDAAKHQRVLALGRRLPKVRLEVAHRLAEPGLGQRRVLAAAVRMLDIGVFRAGGEQYAPSCDDDEGSFGLATLRREHVRLHRGAILIDYVAKGGISRTLELRDQSLHRVVGSLLRRRGGGAELLAYRDGRSWRDVRTSDLNNAVKELAGPRYTCKDLRTWNATVLAAAALAGQAADGIPDTPRAQAKLVTAAMREVADHLGNTPAVARASYVDPILIERFEQGRTVLPTLRRLNGASSADLSDEGVRTAIEAAVIRLLRS
ncbi:MAG: DNA topoisomerase IB [Actinomycetota bacterium]|nr:DNA topoisomerase IB [Actinomycetota bacterium]